jgi:pimeloyl-ACP methyl ester carboxylesterase
MRTRDLRMPVRVYKAAEARRDAAGSGSPAAEAMRAVKPEWHALFHDPTPLGAFAEINVPTLLLTGINSKAPALAIARLLTKVLPRVRVEEIEGVGHMAPVTHPERTNPLIERFLEATHLPLAGDAPHSARA